MPSDIAMTRSLLFCGLLALCAPAAHAQSTAAAAPRPWVVATYAYPQRDREAAIRPLADYLAARGGRATALRLFPSPTDLVEALRRGEVDVAVPNLHAYLQTRRWRASAPVTLPVPQVPAAQAERYRAVLVGRSDAVAADSLRREAPRLRLVLVGQDSASGGFVPAHHLRRLGLDPASDFAGLSYAGSHAAALQALSEGRAEVAALAADVYDAARPAGLVELWRSPPIPPGPLLCRPAPDVPCAEIAAWLLQAHTEAPSVMAALRAGWPEFGEAAGFTSADADALGALATRIE